MEEGRKTLRLNLGILGHVDSGKTSLSKALSEQGSTAAFDKHPQSQERGITLDLGFSVFHIGGDSVPKRFREAGFAELQLTLVDCPGHASFIRTIIGGAQIIDFMLLVIDSTKGVQTQTAESLVIGELTANNLVVAMNKIDCFKDGVDDEEYKKVAKKVSTILSKTKFAGCPLVPCAANPKSGSPIGLDKLIAQLAESAPLPIRSLLRKEDFLFSVDHCFSLKGQGTVLTGTVLRGSVEVNDNVEVADLSSIKKVKSIQMFRKPVTRIEQGDRAGVCVTQFDSSTLERGIVCFPGSVKSTEFLLVDAAKIRYFAGEVTTGTKFHISIGHRTAVAKAMFLKAAPSNEYEWLPGLDKGDVVALLCFETSVLCPRDAIYIASRLDLDESAPTCRIAFHGKVMSHLEPSKTGFEGTSLRVFKRKEKFATIDRVVSDEEVICRGLFGPNFDMDSLSGMILERESDGAKGTIRGSFGSAKNAKFKAVWPQGGFENAAPAAPPTSKRIVFRYKRYLGGAIDPKKKWIQ